MYTFAIRDSAGNTNQYKHINKVQYSNSVSTVSLEGEDILTHNYKTSYDLHLFGDQVAYTVSKSTIEVIQVTKEN